MKCYLFFLLLITSCAGSTQSSLKTRQDTIAVLCTDWKLTLTEFDTEKIPVEKNEEKFFLIGKDGKYRMKYGDLIIDGTWILEKGSKIFTTNDEEGIKKWTVIKVSASELVLQTTTPEEGRMKVFLVAKN